MRARAEGAELVLNPGNPLTEITSEKVPVIAASFNIKRVGPEGGLVIRNDANGNPRMPTSFADTEPHGIEVEAELVGAGVTQEVLDNLSLCWRAKVEYVINSKYRPRRGLSGDNDDGFLIPASEDRNNREPRMGVSR